MKDRIRQLFPQFDGAGQALLDKAYGVAFEALSGLTRGNGRPFMEHPENVVIRKGYIPETLAGIDESFCFVNLDLDLVKPTLSALEFFWDKMVPGGGILIHDFYNEFSFPNLRRGVIEFCAIKKICFFPIGDSLSVFLPKTRN